MKKIVLFIMTLILASCQSTQTVKKTEQDLYLEKLSAAREKDAEWKKHVAILQKNLQENNSPENQMKFYSRFESWNPYSGNYEFIKEKITKTHDIKHFENVLIPLRDGIQLNGWFIPVKNPKATLIVLHGWGSDMDFSLGQSKFLLDLGYQILVYNARFWTYANDPYQYVGFIGNDLEDIGDVIRFLSKRSDVDMKKLGIIGFSYGAEKSVLAGARYPEIRFVIADAPPVRENAYSQEYVDLMKTKLGMKDSTVTVETLDILKAAKKLSPKPLLLLHGEKDTVIHPDQSRMVLKAAGEPKLLATFPNSGHCLGMMTSDKEIYIKTVDDFLKEKLAALK